jgi:hypothetical protein
MMLRLTRLVVLAVLALSAVLFVGRGVWTPATGRKGEVALLVIIAAGTYLAVKVSEQIQGSAASRVH